MNKEADFEKLEIEKQSEIKQLQDQLEDNFELQKSQSEIERLQEEVKGQNMKISSLNK